MVDYPLERILASARPIVVAAGGTGGHLFPAEALAHALRNHGMRVVLMTDTRAAEFAGGFPAEAVHAVPAATPSGRSLFRRAEAAVTLAQGVLAARRLLKQIRPSVVVGFGGYPTVPPVLGASFAGVRCIIHEQNAVLGRANRFLAGRATLIATGFAELGGVSPALAAKCRHVGNPVRPAVVQAVSPYRPPGEGTFHLLVFGGSQGARIMADIVPPAIELLTPQERARLVITQQARAEDHERVAGIYERLGLQHEVAPFFKDLPTRMAQAHLVIGRSGASTIAELSVMGRPSILVPLPGALDQDQAANAAFLDGVGGAIRILQPEFTPSRLASELSGLLKQPSHLTVMAENAKSAGIPDAADRLARLVMGVANS